MNIKELRLQRYLSQRQLAAMAGVSYTTMCRIEKGKHKPTELTIRKIAGALGVDPFSIEY